MTTDTGDNSAGYGDESSSSQHQQDKEEGRVDVNHYGPPPQLQQQVDSQTPSTPEAVIAAMACCFQDEVAVDDSGIRGEDESTNGQTRTRAPTEVAAAGAEAPQQQQHTISTDDNDKIDEQQPDPTPTPQQHGGILNHILSKGSRLLFHHPHQQDHTTSHDDDGNEQRQQQENANVVVEKNEEEEVDHDLQQHPTTTTPQNHQHHHHPKSIINHLVSHIHHKLNATATTTTTTTTNHHHPPSANINDQVNEVEQPPNTTHQQQEQQNDETINMGECNATTTPLPPPASSDDQRHNNNGHGHRHNVTTSTHNIVEHILHPFKQYHRHRHQQQRGELQDAAAAAAAVAKNNESVELELLKTTTTKDDQTTHEVVLLVQRHPDPQDDSNSSSNQDQGHHHTIIPCPKPTKFHILDHIVHHFQNHHQQPALATPTSANANATTNAVEVVDEAISKELLKGRDDIQSNISEFGSEDYNDDDSEDSAIVTPSATATTETTSTNHHHHSNLNIFQRIFHQGKKNEDSSDDKNDGTSTAKDAIPKKQPPPRTFSSNNRRRRKPTLAEVMSEISVSERTAGACTPVGGANNIGSLLTSDRSRSPVPGSHATGSSSIRVAVPLTQMQELKGKDGLKQLGFEYKFVKCENCCGRTGDTATNATCEEQNNGVVPTDTNDAIMNESQGLKQYFEAIDRRNTVYHGATEEDDNAATSDNNDVDGDGSSSDPSSPRACCACDMRLYHTNSDTMVTEENRKQFIEDGDVFAVVSKCCQEYIQQEILIPRYNMKFVNLEPESGGGTATTPSSTTSSGRNATIQRQREPIQALMTTDIPTTSGAGSSTTTKNKATLLIIGGKGTSRAGILSTRHALESGITIGSAIYHIEQAYTIGCYGSIVCLDPNCRGTAYGMEVISKSLNKLFLDNSNEDNIYDTLGGMTAPPSTTTSHAYFYDIPPLHILVHSAGGGYLMRFLLNLLETNKINEYETLVQQIKKLCLTDSTHNIQWLKIHSEKHPQQTKYLKNLLQCSTRCLYIRNNTSKATGYGGSLDTNTNTVTKPGEVMYIPPENDCNNDSNNDTAATTASSSFVASGDGSDSIRFWIHRFGTIPTVWAGTSDHSKMCYVSRHVIWKFFS